MSRQILIVAKAKEPTLREPTIKLIANEETWAVPKVIKDDTTIEELQEILEQGKHMADLCRVLRVDVDLGAITLLRRVELAAAGAGAGAGAAAAGGGAGAAASVVATWKPDGEETVSFTIAEPDSPVADLDGLAIYVEYAAGIKDVDVEKVAPAPAAAAAARGSKRGGGGAGSGAAKKSRGGGGFGGGGGGGFGGASGGASDTSEDGGAKPFNGGKSCGYCGNPGHMRTTCPERIAEAAEAAAEEEGGKGGGKGSSKGGGKGGFGGGER
jgi:hypothetical protein